MAFDCASAPSTTERAFPVWLPEDVELYLLHVESRRPLREIARLRRLHASTVLRRIRRVEARRDDPLFDQALSELGTGLLAAVTPRSSEPKETAAMTTMMRPAIDLDEARITREARRVLRRLCESGASLVVAPGMERAVVVRQGPGAQEPVKTAVLDTDVARAFAVKEWIACAGKGKVIRYQITAPGRAALKRLLADAAAASPHAPHAEQHREWETRTAPPSDGEEGAGAPRRLRYNLAESPLIALARRRDTTTGQPFLGRELVDAGERLREDFELAQMGPRVAQNWERFMTAGDRGAFGPSGPADGPQGARQRVMEALSALGPGLGDILLRCCCFLEGLETAEKRMGWSARSGKIVLRIALQQLRKHYDSSPLQKARMIG
jgi:DNA-binding PadR family transcriptional regulator